MNLRIALVDMDGTLLGADQVFVSERNRKALSLLHEKGVLVIPCTGRVADMLPPQVLSEPWIRYVVSSHGARVYDRHAGVSLYENVLSPAESAQVLAAFEGRGLYAEVAAAHTIYIEQSARALLACPPVPSHHVWYMCERQAYTAVPSLSEHFRQERLGIEKVNIYGIPGPLQASVYAAVTATGRIRHTRGAAAPDLEFSGLSLNKSDAIDTLLAHLGASYDDVFAIGDSSTDLEVIQKAHVGVVMGNAPEDIRRAADYVTLPNTQDGFAHAVERYFSA